MYYNSGADDPLLFPDHLPHRAHKTAHVLKSHILTDLYQLAACFPLKQMLAIV